MIQKIKNIFLATSTSVLLVLGMLTSFGIVATTPGTSLAKTTTCTTTSGSDQQQCLNTNLCNGSNFDLSGGSTATGAQNCAGDSNNLESKIKKILNLLSALIGIVAVIMIVYAGFRYVTSAGSEAGVKAAKNAIIYAIIGLVVVALAQVIVHFVITNAVS